MQNVHFTPPELARRLGVNESTIKRWIDRGILKADRTSGGHRRVSDIHLCEFIDRNPKLGKKSYHIKRWRECETCDWRRYYDLHLQGKAHEAREYLHTRYIVTGDVLRVFDEVVLPTLHEIGAAWRREELDIVDEHRMSFYIRSDLLTLMTLLPAPKDTAPSAVLACVPGENHELALVLLALLARQCGWNSIVLGINVPLDQVRQTAASMKAQAVVLVRVYAGSKNLAKDLTAFSRGLPASTQTYIGGPGWSERELRDMAKLRTITALGTYRDFAAALMAALP